MQGRLLNKVCVITGTAGSMGQAAALKFSQEGAKVVGCDLNATADTATVDLVREQGGEMVSLAPCDLTKREDCEKLVNLAIKTYGRIDVLYNNAGMAYFAWMDDIADEQWHKTIDQELNIVYLLTKVAWPHLKSSHASIINVGSVNGWVGLRALPAIAHVAAKGGIIAMTRQLAMEGRTHGIRANSISPGVIETKVTAEFLKSPEWSSAMADKIMINRFGQPEDVASVASFLASDESAYITAADIRVDGGLTAW
ncbi:3-oxoacyl-[acyl-carrier-protein] reductase FabG [Penicillium rolfsii]|nr:3-oxoacyl-[acyl-carrier-protein] reductase FabG [Penicillium rolfsii]